MSQSCFRFNFRSKQQMEEDAQDYETWAFPYGSSQKKKIQTLLQCLFPAEDLNQVLFTYLSARQAYWGTCRPGVPCAEDESAATHELKRLLPFRKQKNSAQYLSLIVSDAFVDEHLEYDIPK